MPLKANAENTSLTTTKLNQFEQFKMLASLIDAAKNAEKFMRMEESSTSDKKDYIISFENFIMVPVDPDSPADYQAYRGIVADEEIMKTISIFNCKIPTEEEARKAYTALTEVNRISPIPLSYKVISNDGEVMGLIMSAVLEKNEKGEPMVLDFGHMFKKEYRGMVPLVVSSVMAKQSFSTSFVQKIIATAIADNYNAQAIILRRKFECIGQVQKENGPLVNIYELTREKFFSAGVGARIKDVKEYVKQISERFGVQKEKNTIKPFCTRS